MALAIFIGIIVVMIWLGGKGKKARATRFEKISANEKVGSIAMDKQRKKEDDELITVILPTINNDGK